MQTTHPKCLVLALPFVVVASAAGCHKTEATAPDAGVAAASASASDSAAVAATAPDDEMADASTEITAPDAVVAQDPNIPVNEAVTGTPPIAADYTADIAPPTQAVAEDQPARPEADDVWVPGYWWWSRPLKRYVWVGGAWRQPPPDQVWSPGRWNLVSGHYAWAPGYWGPHGYARETIDVAPPPLQVEVRPAAPGADFVWTPGYYGWRGGKYAWTGGSWARPPRAGVGWVEPHYVNTGGHYYFQPGRWDYAADHRGVVYRPDINVRPGAHVKLEAIAPTVLVAHANYVAESHRAIERGARPDEHGTIVVPRAVVREVVRPEEHPRVEVRPGAAVEVRPGVVETRERGAAVEVRPPAVGARVEVRPPVVGGRVEVRPAVTATAPPRGREQERRR